MSFGLDTPSKKELEDGRPFTLRYVLLHLIEETSLPGTTATSTPSAN